LPSWHVSWQSSLLLDILQLWALENKTFSVPAEGLQTYSMSHVCKTDRCFDIYALQSQSPPGSITSIDEQDNDKTSSPGAETSKPSSALAYLIILSHHQAHHIDLTILDQIDISNKQDLMGW
jgi:hypothetical protein